MKWQTGLIIILIIFAAGSSFYLFIRPALIDEPNIVTDRQLEYLGRSPEGEKAYTVSHPEITYWVEQISKLTPFLALCVTIWIQRRKYKRELLECRNGKKTDA